MGAKTAMSLEQYLHTSFPDLDKEYRCGEVVERSLPNYLHGITQLLLGAYFLALRKKHSLFPCVETRMKIRPDLVVIPDVAVFYPTKPGAVPDTPPFIAIEVLSPDDRMNAVRAKLQEYRAWGVQHVWLVDPDGRHLYTCDAGLIEVEVFRIPELGIELGASQIFE